MGTRPRVRVRVSVSVRVKKKQCESVRSRSHTHTHTVYAGGPQRSPEQPDPADQISINDIVKSGGRPDQ